MYTLRIVCCCYFPSREMVWEYLLGFHRQTRKEDVKLTIYHDGPGSKTKEYIEELSYLFKEGQIEYLETPTRLHNETTREGWGHPQKALAIKTTEEKYIKFDNIDNYMVPRCLEIALNRIETTGADLILFNTLHNYDGVMGDGKGPYNVLITSPVLNRVDVSSFIVLTSLAKETGWNDYSTGGDGIFISQVVNWNPQILVVKADQVLNVHN